MNNATYERILMKFKDSKDYREMMVMFGVFLSGQPAEVIKHAYSDFINGLRNSYLKENEGKRSAFKLKHLWDTETSFADFENPEIIKINPDELKQKTLLMKNVNK